MSQNLTFKTQNLQTNLQNHALLVLNKFLQRELFNNIVTILRLVPVCTKSSLIEFICNYRTVYDYSLFILVCKIPMRARSTQPKGR